MKTKCNNLTHTGVKTLVLFAVIIALTTANTFAGKGKTNFAGTWTLNETKTTQAQGGFGPAKMLTVTQDGNKMTVVRTQTGRNGEERTISLNYTLDGKECDNSNDRRTSKSVVLWSEDGLSLTINTRTTSERNGEKFEASSTEIWKLTEDGKSLIIDQTMNSQRGERKAVLNYDKKQ